MGTKPFIGVGGNTQHYDLYNVSQDTALVGKIDPDRSPDYPTTNHIGPAYFESYQTLPGVKFSHGFNLGLGGNNSEGWQTLADTVPWVCKTLGLENLYTTVMNLTCTLYRPKVRCGLRRGMKLLTCANGSMAQKQFARSFTVTAPSFLRCSLSLWHHRLHLFRIHYRLSSWEAGLNRDKDIQLYSTHK